MQTKIRFGINDSDYVGIHHLKTEKRGFLYQYRSFITRLHCSNNLVHFWCNAVLQTTGGDARWTAVFAKREGEWRGGRGVYELRGDAARAEARPRQNGPPLHRNLRTLRTRLIHHTHRAFLLPNNPCSGYDAYIIHYLISNYEYSIRMYLVFCMHQSYCFSLIVFSSYCLLVISLLHILSTSSYSTTVMNTNDTNEMFL